METCSAGGAGAGPGEREPDRGAAVVMPTQDPQAAEACDGELHLDDGVLTWVRQFADTSDMLHAEGVACTEN